MNAESENKLTYWFGVYARIASVACAIVSALALTGWLADIPGWVTLGLSPVPIRPNAALAILLTSVGLWLMAPNHERTPTFAHTLGRSFGLVAALIGSATLWEHVSGWNLGIDALLAGRFAHTDVLNDTIRIPTNAALACGLLGVSICFLDSREKIGSTLGQVSAVGATSLGLVAVLGHTYQAGFLTGLGAHAMMAENAAYAFVALGTGILAVRPERWIAANLVCPCPGGDALRRLVPTFFVLVFGLGLAVRACELSGCFGVGMAVAIMVAGTLAVSTTLLFSTARHLHRVDAARRVAERDKSTFLSRLNGVLQLSGQVLAETTIPSMLQRIADVARELIGAEYGTVGHRYREKAFQLGVYCSPKDTPLYSPGQVVHAEKGGVYLRITEQGERLRLTKDELLRQADWWGLPEGHAEVRGLLGVPLICDNEKPSGLIMISGKITGEFTEDDELLLSHLAALASLALRQAEARTTAEQHAEELASVNREIEAFSYSVSHDLRAPLREADGFSAALLKDCGDNLSETCKSHVQQVRAATQRMGDLIDDLLDLSRVGRYEMRQESINLSELAQSIVEGLRSVDPGRHVEASIQPGLSARGDPHLLGVALDNLLSNAWKFTSKQETARIEFGATGEDGERVYFVRDNGAGFDPAYADKLFAPFQRLHSTADYPGIGIGLATVQRVIHRHRGRVWAEGMVGQGATFRFTLPAD